MAKRCIIIGSGLGGLSCGVILARNGYDVTILEQGAQIGGCLQCFTRRGVCFETGMHFIGSADEGQTLNRLLRYLGVMDSIELNRLDTTGYNVVSLGGERFRFANGREPFIEQMAGYFPREKDNIVKYYDLVEHIAGASSLHSLRYAESDLAVSTEYQLRSINDVLAGITSDTMLQSVLVGDLPLYAAEKDKTPFSTHAFIMDFYNQSAFRIVGGSDRIAKAMVQTLEAHGGEVLTNKKVTQILCNETQATGVITADECFYPADIVISDTHPAVTLGMLDTKLIRPAFRQRITSMRNTTSGFTVYLHFRKDSVPYMNSNFYKYSGDTPWGCEDYDSESWPKGYLYMHFCHKRNPQYADSGVILSYMSMEEMKPWENTSIGRRGEDYEQFKRMKAEKLIAELQREFPETEGSIEHWYTSTPLTYRDYTGTPGGSMYGVAKDISLGISNRVPHKTRIPNLLQTGQNINSHGILGVLVGTIVTCSELLTAEHIYNRIIESER